MQESSSLQGRGGVALLIDADNLSSPESVEETLRRLTELVGPVAIRRAYGSADNLKGLATVMRDYAAQGRIGGEVYRGAWTDVGTIERLEQLNAPFRGKEQGT